MPETAYDHPLPGGGRLAHHYGDNVHILSDPWGLSLAARLSHPDVDTRGAHPILASATRHLLAAAVEQLPMRSHDVPTRMTAGEPRARLTGSWIDADEPVVIVDIARGGMVPSHLMHTALMDVVHPSRVRVDHVYLQRLSDPDTGAVTGVGHSGSKIGGPVAGATVFIPDPMAATGSSASYVLDQFRTLEGGPPRRFVLLHVIMTPEYLARVARDAPDVVVYALRLDRGLSSDEVLGCVPGARWEEERGLDDHSYIVPGAGGVGELLNNAWV